MTVTLFDKTRRALGAWHRDETGNATVEFVIWFPIYMVALVMTINVSMIFFGEANVLRVTQDANRAYALGRLDTTTETEDYIRAQMGNAGDTATISSVENQGFVTTTVSVPATSLMPMGIPKFGMSEQFNTIDVTVVAQHMVEY